MESITYNAHRPMEMKVSPVPEATSQTIVSDDTVVVTFGIYGDLTDEALNDYARRIAEAYKPDYVIAQGLAKSLGFVTSDGTLYEPLQGRILLEYEPVSNVHLASRGSLSFEHVWSRAS